MYILMQWISYNVALKSRFLDALCRYSGNSLNEVLGTEKFCLLY